MEAATFDDPAAFEAEVRRLVAFVADLERLRDTLLATEHQADEVEVKASLAEPELPSTDPATVAIADLKTEIWRREGILAEARPLAALSTVKATLCPQVLAAPPDSDLVAVLLPALLPLAGPSLPRDPEIFAGIIGLIVRDGAAQYCTESGA